MSKTYLVEVSDAEDMALAVVAKRDSTTVEELVQNQLNYYLNCVIRGYVDEPVKLDESKTNELNAVLATTKATFIASATAEPKQTE